MAYYNTDSKVTVINKVIAIAKQKLPKNKIALITEFIQYYYAAVAQEDLLDRDPVDLYGAALSHWNFLNERTGNKEAIHIYNPTFEQHGWQSKHTVIEIATNSMPFLVDSLRIVLNRYGLTVHMIIHPGTLILKRDDNHEIVKIEEASKHDEKSAKVKLEEPIYVEIDRQSDPAFLKQLKKSISDAFDDIKYAVQDWPEMKAQTESLSEELKAVNSASNSADMHETLTFLRWMAANHFTFLGCCDFVLTGKSNEKLKLVEDSMHGLYRKGKFLPTDMLATGTPEARTQIFDGEHTMLIEVYSEPSSVHRPTMPYCISVKRYNPDGKLIGERRFVGHFTSSAYFSAPKAIPFLRRKVERIIQLSSFYEQSHSGREFG